MTLLLADEHLGIPTRILAALVADGVIDFKVAILRPTASGSSHRIFYDKLGIFRAIDPLRPASAR